MQICYNAVLNKWHFEKGYYIAAMIYGMLPSSSVLLLSISKCGYSGSIFP